MRFILAFLLCFNLGLHARTIKVLWLGNSYVTTQNLPGLFYNLALSGGDTIVYQQNAPGGNRLMNHFNDAASIQKIYADQWDYVIVQGQSQEPSFPPAQVDDEVLPYARALDSLIRDNNPCSETVFYMTWGRKYGDNMNCGVYPTVCTFEGMTQRLRESYMQMANDNQAITAPAGMAWYHSRNLDSTINLWSGDLSHPALEGAYLTACVFYETILRKNPVGLSFNSGLSSVVTAHLQQVAHRTVSDSLENWKIGSFDPEANFQFTANGFQVDFESVSANASDYNWNFGDGNSGSGSSVQHSYSAAGSFTVELIAFTSCGLSDTFQNTIIIEPTGIEEQEENRFCLLPNFGEGIFKIESNQSVLNFELFDTYGQKLGSSITSKNQMIDISGLPNGLYWVRTQAGKQMQTMPYLKQ